MNLSCQPLMTPDHLCSTALLRGHGAANKPWCIHTRPAILLSFPSPSSGWPGVPGLAHAGTSRRC